MLPDIASSTFIYSRLNTTPINTYAKQIIEHMNAQFDEFKEAGTAGKDIVMNNGSEIFSNWIIDSYRNKGARYFITNNYTILPVERFSEYFNVSAKYRVKRSGSSHVGKSNISNVLNYIKSNGYNIESSRTDAGKLLSFQRNPYTTNVSYYTVMNICSLYETLNTKSESFLIHLMQTSFFQLT